jgi:hypothetical protein
MKARAGRRIKLALLGGLAGALVAREVRAEPLRLRGDALVQSRSPVGLLVLSGEDRAKPWIDAEGVAWLGVTDKPDATGDVLTLSVRLRDSKGLGELRAGRMVISGGAIRPMHIDGARGLVRAPWGTSVEAFGGIPVAPRFDYWAYDWAAGGRVAQSVGSAFVVGGSYVQRRSDGRRADEEGGVDFALTPRKLFTASGRMAFDLVSYGVTDALLSASLQQKTWRLEAFATHRSPGRLLPSTSLFSVLGDFASTSVGGTVRWRAFPRLELLGTAQGQGQGGQAGGQGLGRVTLAFDDAWAGNVGLEVRRVHFAAARWLGARLVLVAPLPLGLRVATEVELVRPDDPKGRGEWWPWGLGALAWSSGTGWEVGAAVETSAGPEYRSEVHVLGRLSFAYERSR